ncbi:hypothetical protein GCM10009827_104960 [Dactylosporangium maewongense]|uniref:DoxX family protein n=1 Tax=Dactylosporangium maewongense TaxID=634393 RepID=A0ABP4NWK2_9ACTN
MRSTRSGIGGLARLSDVALSAIFIHAGYRVASRPAGLAKKLDAFTRRYLGFEIPNSAALVRLNAAAMVAGGAALALGVWPRSAAAALALSLQPTNVVGHPFWESEGAERTSELNAFLSNMAITGGLIMVATRDLQRCGRAASGPSRWARSPGTEWEA